MIPIIVIIPYIYLLLFHKPIEDKPQRRRVIFYCLITQFCFLKWSGTSFNCHESTSRTLIHIVCVLKYSGTIKNTAGLLRTAWLHIPYVLRWSSTYSRVYGSLRTTLLYISCVLKQFGIYTNVDGSSLAASLHICCVLGFSRNLFIQRITDIFYLYLWAQARIKFYGHNAEQPLNRCFKA